MKIVTIVILIICIIICLITLVYNPHLDAPVNVNIGNVYCILNQPIKGYEFKMKFNQSLITINSITEGDIFTGYQTFFNPGIIDNVNGTVINIYGLIVGQGNVTTSGSFIVINYISKDNIKSFPFTLYDVGVCNELGYIKNNVDNEIIYVESLNVN